MVWLFVVAPTAVWLVAGTLAFLALGVPPEQPFTRLELWVHSLFGMSRADRRKLAVFERRRWEKATRENAKIRARIDKVRESHVRSRAILDCIRDGKRLTAPEGERGPRSPLDLKPFTEALKNLRTFEDTHGVPVEEPKFTLVDTHGVPCPSGRGLMAPPETNFARVLETQYSTYQTVWRGVDTDGNVVVETIYPDGGRAVSVSAVRPDPFVFLPRLKLEPVEAKSLPEPKESPLPHALNYSEMWWADARGFRIGNRTRGQGRLTMPRKAEWLMWKRGGSIHRWKIRQWARGKVWRDRNLRSQDNRPKPGVKTYTRKRASADRGAFRYTGPFSSTLTFAEVYRAVPMDSTVARIVCTPTQVHIVRTPESCRKP